MGINRNVNSSSFELMGERSSSQNQRSANKELKSKVDGGQYLPQNVEHSRSNVSEIKMIHEELINERNISELLAEKVKILNEELEISRCRSNGKGKFVMIGSITVFLLFIGFVGGWMGRGLGWGKQEAEDSVSDMPIITRPISLSVGSTELICDSDTSSTDYEIQSVRFISDNVSVATVSDDGQVTAVAPGNAVIYGIVANRDIITTTSVTVDGVLNYQPKNKKSVNL